LALKQENPAMFAWEIRKVLLAEFEKKELMAGNATSGSNASSLTVPSISSINRILRSMSSPMQPPNSSMMPPNQPITSGYPDILSAHSYNSSNAAAPMSNGSNWLGQGFMNAYHHHPSSSSTSVGLTSADKNAHSAAYTTASTDLHSPASLSSLSSSPALSSSSSGSSPFSASTSSITSGCSSTNRSPSYDLGLHHLPSYSSSSVYSTPSLSSAHSTLDCSAPTPLSAGSASRNHNHPSSSVRSSSSSTTASYGLLIPSTGSDSFSDGPALAPRDESLPESLNKRRKLNGFSITEILNQKARQGAQEEEEQIDVCEDRSQPEEVKSKSLQGSSENTPSSLYYDYYYRAMMAQYNNQTLHS
jgi:hypothetical protein